MKLFEFPVANETDYIFFFHLLLFIYIEAKKNVYIIYIYFLKLFHLSFNYF